MSLSVSDTDFSEFLAAIIRENGEGFAVHS